MAPKKPVLLSVWLLLAGFLATTTALMAPATAQTPACEVSAADQAIDAEEQQMLALVNNYRVANNLLPLGLSPHVTRAASWFSRDQAANNYLSLNHIDRNGRYIPERLTWCGVPWTAWSENVYAGTPDAQSAFNWWRNSPPHNANMLNPNVTLVGIARAFQAGTTYGWYWTMDFTAPPAPVNGGATWYLNGTNAGSGTVGATVNAYAVAAFEDVAYQLVLATSGCNATVAVLNPTQRFANSSGFIPRTVGTIPAGVPAGNYTVCFRSTPDLAHPTVTTPATFTRQ